MSRMVVRLNSIQPLLGPANKRKVIKVDVALDRTEALEFLSAPLRNSIKFLSERPAIPNSVKA